MEKKKRNSTFLRTGNILPESEYIDFQIDRKQCIQKVTCELNTKLIGKIILFGKQTNYNEYLKESKINIEEIKSRQRKTYKYKSRQINKRAINTKPITIRINTWKNNGEVFLYN